MIYIRLENSIPVEISNEFPKNAKPLIWAVRDGKNSGNGWINRNDIDSFKYAMVLASQLTIFCNELYLAADDGDHTFNVFKAPVVGDKVSKSFNGDSYPEGVITKITPSWQITTSTGAKFRRYKNTAGFRETGRGFWMIGGHVYEQNPSF